MTGLSGPLQSPRNGRIRLAFRVGNASSSRKRNPRIAASSSMISSSNRVQRRARVGMVGHGRRSLRAISCRRGDRGHRCVSLRFSKGSNGANPFAHGRRVLVSAVQNDAAWESVPQGGRKEWVAETPLLLAPPSTTKAATEQEVFKNYFIVAGPKLANVRFRSALITVIEI